MNPTDREHERQWQADALESEPRMETLDDGRIVMGTDAEDEWLVFEG